jgi:hypothetical protein
MPGNSPLHPSHSSAEARGTVALCAVHLRLTFRGEQWPYHLLALNDGQIFLSRRPPALYDSAAHAIPLIEIPSGSTVRVRYQECDGVHWMDAVQIVRLAVVQSPFDPVAEGETG